MDKNDPISEDTVKLLLVSDLEDNYIEKGIGSMITYLPTNYLDIDLI